MVAAVTGVTAPAAAGASHEGGKDKGDVARHECGSPSCNRRLGRRLLDNHGFGRSQMRCLGPLWHRESHWDETARNPSSGAGGIPQALPASKMGRKAQGRGFKAAKAQIQWGLRYIRERYGSPCGAWSFWLSHNWY